MYQQNVDGTRDMLMVPEEDMPPIRRCAGPRRRKPKDDEGSHQKPCFRKHVMRENTAWSDDSSYSVESVSERERETTTYRNKGNRLDKHRRGMASGSDGPYKQDQRSNKPTYVSKHEKASKERRVRRRSSREESQDPEAASSTGRKSTPTVKGEPITPTKIGTTA
eukprot:13272671-Alexandrium_andersonii.AAC.1